MIILTKPNGNKFVLNSDLIKTFESVPDTILTLTTNEKLWVKESVAEVMRAVLDFKREIKGEVKWT